MTIVIALPKACALLQIDRSARDQVEDYATRKGWSVAEAERWLAPVLNYDPLAAARTAAE